MNREFMPYHQE